MYNFPGIAALAPISKLVAFSAFNVALKTPVEGTISSMVGGPYPLLIVVYKL